MVTPPIRLGFIGAGWVGQFAHLANFQSLPDCRVEALAELRPRLGAEVAAEFGIPKIYTSHRDLLADPDIDAVVVVTHRPVTGPIVLDCLNNGRPVLCEKPMAHTVEQGTRLVAAAKAAGAPLTVGYMKRHDPGLVEGLRLYRRLVASGELGEVQLLRVWCHGGEFWSGNTGPVMTDEPRPTGLEAWPVAPSWVPADRHADYAWFTNVFCHDINLLRLFAPQMPQVVGSHLGRPRGRAVLFECGGFPAILEMAEAKFAEWREGLEVAFDGGSLSIRFHSPMLRERPADVTLIRGGGDAGVVTPFPGWGWAFRRQAEAFLDTVRNGTPPLADGADSLGDLALIEDIWRHHLAAPASPS